MSMDAKCYRVHKFGGAALASGPKVQQVCGIVGQEREGAVVVVSAHQGVTALLGEVAREAAAGRPSVERVRVRHRGLLRELGLDPELVDRWLRELGAVLASIAGRRTAGPVELDHVLSFGERLSARIVASALRGRGIAATPVDAFDLGLVSDGVFGRARPVAGVERDLRERLAEVPGVPVVTGFLAKDRAGRLTTLGRNGSDLTAAIVAEALGAAELVLWKAVGGVLSADPSWIPDAHVLGELDFEQALELARAGAEVLHPDAIAPVRRGGVRLRVADVARPELPGTRVVEGPVRSGPLAVVGRTGLVRLALAQGAAESTPDLLTDLAGLLRAAAEWRLVVARPGELELWLDASALGKDPEAPDLPERLRPWLAQQEARFDRDLALLHLIGGPQPEGAPRALAHLAAAGIKPLRVLAGEAGRGQVFGLRGEDYPRALQVLHEALVARALDAA